ncbi:hypothetical protein ACFVZC_17065 [Streptomyces marokkonensis]|uniref:Uncharacterized protein n=1 Tax=Streptomyces marokkonensis TaxID=324855 RepID=A0ABW6Q7B9_9ACTN
MTEQVHRKQIRPVIQTGAVIMDGIFTRDPERQSRRKQTSQATHMSRLADLLFHCRGGGI